MTEILQIKPEIRRNSSIELMRLLLMFMIVFHHGIVHGLGLDSFAAWSTNTPILSQSDLTLYALINVLFVMSVNVFMLISGYYGLKFSIRKFVILIFSIAFYKIVFTTSCSVYSGEIISVIKSLFFFSNGYWFINAYLCMMLFSPLLNYAFENGNRSYIRFLIVVLLFVSCYLGFIQKDRVFNYNGYTIIQFIMLYLIGRYIKTYWKMSYTKIVNYLVFLFSLLLNMSIVYYIIHNGEAVNAWWMFSYNNPVLIIQSVSFLLIFANLNFYNGIINKLSKSALGIYLLQNTVIVSTIYYGACKWSYFNTIIVNNTFWNSFITITFLSLLICCMSFIIDPLRRLITNYLYDRIFQYLKIAKR